MLTSTRRLDSGIEGQQVRLLSDLRNRIDNRADLIRLVTEFLDDLGRFTDRLLDELHLLHRTGYLLLPGISLRFCGTDNGTGMVEGLLEFLHIHRQMVDMLTGILDLCELLTARTSHIDNRICHLPADLSRLLGAIRQLLRRRSYLLAGFCHLTHHVMDLLLEFLQRLAHLANLITAMHDLREGFILAEITSRQHAQPARDQMDRADHGPGSIKAQAHKSSQQDDNDAAQLHDARPERRISFGPCISYLRIDVVNPDTRTDNPLIWCERRRVVALRQRRRLIRFCKHQIRIAATIFAAILDHFLDEMTPFRISQIDARLALGIAAEQNDVDTLISVDPEIARTIIVAHVADKICRLLLRLLLRQLALLLAVVDLLDDRDG